MPQSLASEEAAHACRPTLPLSRPPPRTARPPPHPTDLAWICHTEISRPPHPSAMKTAQCKHRCELWDDHPYAIHSTLPEPKPPTLACYLTCRTEPLTSWGSSQPEQWRLPSGHANKLYMKHNHIFCWETRVPSPRRLPACIQGFPNSETLWPQAFWIRDSQCI